MSIKVNHEAHDQKWQFDLVFPGGGGSCEGSKVMCLACIMETLEDPNILVIKKKPALSQLLTLLTACSSQTVKLLQADVRITLHMALVLLGECWFLINESRRGVYRLLKQLNNRFIFIGIGFV